MMTTDTPSSLVAKARTYSYSFAVDVERLEDKLAAAEAKINEHSCAAGVDPCCCPCLKTWKDACETAEAEIKALRGAFNRLHDFVSGNFKGYDAAEVASVINAALESGKSEEK